MRPLARGFLESVERTPDGIALEVGDEALTYADLATRASAFARLMDATQGGASRLTAVFGHRTAAAFTGVLAALLRGHGFVPLNPKFPLERTRAMLDRAGCEALIVDETGVEQLPDLLRGKRDPLTVIVPDRSLPEGIAAELKPHVIAEHSDASVGGSVYAADSSMDDVAYLLFTSGSTGVPKGVAVTHANVRSFVDFATAHYAATPDDRFSQTFDFTFDLSVFDMFVPWEVGACVCCPSERQLLRPDKYLEASDVSVWFSVPSLAIVMRRLGALRPARFPRLRFSLFCGEPLPVEIAKAWAASAPNSRVENLYGPTEATIACTHYLWSDAGTEEAEHGIVPIGKPFPQMTTLVAGPDLRAVPLGEPGELLLAGPQVTPGYLDDPSKTAEAFVTLEDGQRYYRTGDRVRQRDAEGPLLFLGRVDHQIKVRGYRVELGEIEAAVRAASGSDAVVAVGWPRTEAGYSGVEVFVAAADVDIAAVQSELRALLPDYMVPRQIRTLDELPLNPNGKFDRGALQALLENA